MNQMYRSRVSNIYPLNQKHKNEFENILKSSIFGSIGLGLPSKVCTKYKKTLRDQNIY